ncbi:LOB domain-containing protein 36-like [Lotus japonicus]|uniref:LOB domain-containing protein 36-like n=1 Tax=Lotus japonicus TaxID=34305 RepID=UPI00258EDE05|nr:LOB domain-containing protein 36-like [Lotus japonicus]
MSSSNTPCAACKFLRRKCTQECVFAPYFPPENPQRFSSVHRVFGASNVAKLLNELQASQRDDAVKSLAYEADARLRDPVYGCVGFISVLQQRLRQMQAEVAIAKKELGTYVGPQGINYLLANPGPVILPNQQGGGMGGNTNQNAAFDLLANFPPNNMGPAGQGVMAGHGGGQVVIRDPQEQEFLEAQQLAAAAAQQQQQQAMLRSYEQQQQEMMRYNSGGFEAVGVGGGGGYGHQMGVAIPGGGGEVSNSLALFDNVGSYQMQQQPQQGGEYHQHHHVSHQPPVEAQLLLSPQQSQQQSDLEEVRSVGPC